MKENPDLRNLVEVWRELPPHIKALIQAHNTVAK